MNLPPIDIRSVGSTGAPYVTGNFAIYDAERHRSDVVILEARDFAGEPIATVRLPVRVPFTFHGG
jgi:carotenoid cleavage dioxygenase